MGKTIIINESMYNELKESLTVTQFKFKNNLKKFLAELLEDPIGAQPSILFTSNGIDKNRLIKTLIDNKVINKKLRFDDHDMNGNPHPAKMIVKYSVPKHRFNDKLDALFDILFPDIEAVVNEDGGGATSCCGVGGVGADSCAFIQPLFSVQRKTPYTTKPNKKKDVNEAVTGEDVEKSAVTYVYCKDKKDKLYILCAQRIKFPDDEMGGKWNPPMGHLHKGESMIDGAIRECFEESGVTLEKKWLKLVSKEEYGNVYKAVLPGTIDNYPPKKGDEENRKFKWLPIEEIDNLDWAWTCGKIAKKLAKSKTLNEDRKERMSLLLLEVLTPDEIYTKYYSTIDRDIFDAAIAADPTSYNQQGEIVKVGSYVKWILKLYQNGSWKPGDSFETKKVLSDFVKHQKDLPIEQRDINAYSSVRELYDILQPYLGIKSRSEIKQDVEKVYEDNEWLIIIPHTEEAACSYGANTKWCTAGDKNNMFDFYNNDGPLYINIYKSTNRKYQFHFETNQFTDENDEKIQPNDLPWTEGALAYYKSINKYANLMYDSVSNFKKGIAIVKLNNKQTWFSLEKQEVLFPNIWFDVVDNFDSNGIERVKLNGQYNWFIFEKQGLLFPNQWFDWVENFNNGIARVQLKGKLTWFSLEKQDYLFPNQWFDYVDDFYNGIARVKLNGQQTWFSLEKQDYLFPNLWFDDVDDFYEGIATVELSGKQTWFSLEKQDYLFPNLWFNWVSNFKKGIAIVELNGKYTWYSLEKQDYLFPNLWFNNVGDFDSNGIARVILNHVRYYFTLDGQLLDYETKQPLSNEELQQLSNQQQIAEMVNKLVKNYLI